MSKQFNQYDNFEREVDTQGALAFDTFEPTACEGDETLEDDSSEKLADAKTPEDDDHEVYKNSKKFYLSNTDCSPSLSEEEMDRILRNKNRSVEERNAVILTVMRDALSGISWELAHGPRFDCDDAVQEKLLAVIERFNYYDATKGKFSTFAHSVMGQQLSASIAKSQPIPLPKDISFSDHKVNQAKYEAANEGKTDEEITRDTLSPNNDESGAKKVDTYEKAKKHLEYSFVSMQSTFEDSNEELGDRIQDDRAEISEEHMTNRILVENLMNSTDLTELETHVLTDFFVLGYKIKEIAERRGIASEKTCRSIQQSAVNKLRKTAKAMGLDRKAFRARP